MTRFTGDSWAPAINVTCWYFMVVSILALITRLGTKLWIYRKLTRDDYLIIAAVVFDITQAIALSMATANGYGAHLNTLNNHQLIAMMKSQLASHLLGIASLACSKISYVMFVWSITPVQLDRKIGRIFTVALTVWAVVALITVAFQCQPLSTWDYLGRKCYNRLAWENFYSVSNIITELAILAHTFSVVARIQTGLQRKLGIGFVFGLRVFVVGAIVVETVALNRTFHDPDVTYATWSVSITNQLILCLSIITASSAQFKPFLDSLRSTGMRLDAFTGSNSRFQRTNGNYYYGGSNPGSKPISINLRSLTGRSKAEQSRPGAHNETTVSVAPNSPEWDTNSQTSQSRIIRETRTWTVTEERRQSSDVGEAY